MISIVIRNKNQEKALSFLLYNLTERYSEDYDEIIVLDNLSNDASRSISMKYGVRFETIEKFSYGGSANLAAKLAKNNIVVMFSAHSYPVSHDFFQLIKEKFKNRDNLAGLRCLHNLNDYQNYIKNISAEEDPNKSGLIFCGSVFFKPIWEKINFQEDIVTFEDKDWTRKVLASGYKIEMVPSIFCYDIKRSKKEEFFRFKNESVGSLYLWNKKISIKNIFSSLVVGSLKLFRNSIIDQYYIFKRFLFNIKFYFNSIKRTKNNG